jgi:hypothetical protein
LFNFFPSIAQENENSDGVEVQPPPPKPIRPIQNKYFYPEDDEDSGLDKCLVGEFRFLSLNVKNPDLRRSAAEEWIQNNGKYCTVAKLLSIRNNRAQWLGTADSIKIDAEVDKQLEIALDESLEAYSVLFGLQLPPPSEDDDEVQ